MCPVSSWPPAPSPTSEPQSIHAPSWTTLAYSTTNSTDSGTSGGSQPPLSPPARPKSAHLPQTTRQAKLRECAGGGKRRLRASEAGVQCVQDHGHGVRRALRRGNAERERLQSLAQQRAHTRVQVQRALPAARSPTDSHNDPSTILRDRLQCPNDAAHLVPLARLLGARVGWGQCGVSRSALTQLCGDRVEPTSARRAALFSDRGRTGSI